MHSAPYFPCVALSCQLPSYQVLNYIAEELSNDVERLTAGKPELEMPVGRRGDRARVNRGVGIVNQNFTVNFLFVNLFLFYLI